MEKLNKIMNGECEPERKYFTAKIHYKGICPNCGAETENDFSCNHVEYPKFGEVEEISVGCQECDTEIILPIIIHNPTVNIEFLEDQIRIERYDDSK